jgi:Cd2+/Zn2+-exporting ATPase
MAATPSSEAVKFKVTGMDCASCAGKIETALKRVPGTSDIKVSVNSETLSLTLADGARKREVEATVKSLGYNITSVEADQFKRAGQEEKHESHAAPIEDAWSRSAKGKLVIFTGVLIANAFLYSRVLPNGAQLLFLVACFSGTIPVARRALAAARHGSIFTIEMLMTIAVVGAVIIGAVQEAALVVFLFAVGELLEGYAAGRARSGIRALAAVAPKTAMLETEEGLVETPIEKITVGATIVVRPGDRVPADGTVLSGSSSVDESALTGESMPRPKEPGDVVLAGSINAESALRCRVDRPAQDTLIARVVKLVEEAADAKSPTERFIDRFSRFYMPLICALALAAALVPPLIMSEPWFTWIYRALALLLIGCPCALVISTPASVASALAAGARHGLLVKGGGAMEAIGKVKNIAFDKTGTLTEGRPKVTDVVALSDIDEQEILSIAASAEATSSHPLAVAIVNHAKSKNISFAPAQGSEAIPGKGIRATVEGRGVMIGAPARLGVEDPAVLERAQALEQQGKSVSILQVDTKSVALIAMRDEPRADALASLKEIKSLGLKPIMLTGDNRANAEAIAGMLGVDAKAELLPEDKLTHVRELAKQGGIAKVGDGVNDAPALAAATVGIAMGSGTDVALEAADAGILNNRIGDVARLVKLSRQTMSVIHQNVAIALGLKAVFLVTTIIGMTGLWIAILADTGATVLVTANALRLLRS